MFQSYLHDLYEWEFEGWNGEVYHGEEWSIEVFIRKLLKIEPQHYVAAAGTAFHSILENSKPSDEIVTASAEGWDFTFLLDERIYIAPVRELMIYGQVGWHNIRGKCDALDSISVQDNKISTKEFDYNKFFRSWQWKMYLCMTNRHEFLYHIFSATFDLEEYYCDVAKKKKKRLASHNVKITEYYPISLIRYSTMERDCIDILNHYYYILTEAKDLIIDIAREYNVKVWGLTHF